MISTPRNLSIQVTLIRQIEDRFAQCRHFGRLRVFLMVVEVRSLASGSCSVSKLCELLRDWVFSYQHFKTSLIGPLVADANGRLHVLS